jgi:hypothetical protein
MFGPDYTLGAGGHSMLEPTQPRHTNGRHWARLRLAVRGLASISLLAFASLTVLPRRLLTQLVGRSLFRSGQGTSRRAAPGTQALEEVPQTLHAQEAYWATRPKDIQWIWHYRHAAGG